LIIAETLEIQVEKTNLELKQLRICGKGTASYGFTHLAEIKIIANPRIGAEPEIKTEYNVSCCQG